MQGVFPTPYPDELLYSILARYHIRSGNQSMSQTLTDIYGTIDANVQVIIPTGLELIKRNLLNSSSITEETLIAENSLLPYYRPFLSQSRVIKIIEGMK